MYQLKYVALHITENCSHNCSYCYYRTKENLSSHIKGNKFSLKTLKAVIDEIAQNQVKEVFLLGGDPAEYSELLDLVIYAHNKGLILTSVSNTHQYNCDQSQLAKYISTFETTIHGDTKEMHDEFCGMPGAYEIALSGLKYFHDQGCTTGITVNVMPTNADKLYNMILNIVQNYGEILEYVNVQRITPNGRAISTDNYYLLKQNVLKALSQIELIKSNFGLDIQCEDAFPLCLIPKRYWKFIHRCEWGYEKLSINGDGGVSRCGADPRYNLGNVLTTSLKKIWNDSPILHEFRQKKFLPQKCHDCINLNICGGGCVSGSWSKAEFGADILLS